MAKKKNKISMIVKDGFDFYAHETSMNFSPKQFVLDFKNITPRIDPRDSKNRNIIVLRHNVVVMDPMHTKKLAELLTETVKKYEKEFGKIKKTKAQAKMEKKRSNKKKKKERGIPTYFG